MGTWFSSSLIHCQNASRISAAISDVGMHDGYVPVPETIFATGGNSRGWIIKPSSAPTTGVIVVHPASTDWSLVHCYPEDLLCDFSGGHKRPRIALLANFLRCAAFHVEVHDSECYYTIEANLYGDFCVFGITYDEGECTICMNSDFFHAGYPGTNENQRAGLMANHRKAFCLNPEFNILLDGICPMHGDVGESLVEKLSGKEMSRIREEFSVRKTTLGEVVISASPDAEVLFFRRDKSRFS